MSSGFAGALAAASRIKRLINLMDLRKVQYYDDIVFYTIIKATHRNLRTIVDNYIYVLNEVSMYESKSARNNINRLKKKRRKFLLARIEIRSLCETWAGLNNETAESILKNDLYKQYFISVLGLFSVGEKAEYEVAFFRKPNSSPFWCLISLYDALEDIGDEKSSAIISKASDRMIADIEEAWSQVCKVYELLRSTVWTEIAPKIR